MAQNYYTAFTVQAGQVPSTQSNFPVLLLPTDNRFKTIANGGHVASSSGFDLRPYSDTALTTALTYELVPSTYNGSTGFFEMWVNVPSLSSGYTIYLGYGDPALTSDGSSNLTWDSNFKGVYHLPNGSTLSPNDSSQSGINGTVNGATASASGQIDGCGSFVAASSEDISFGDVQSITTGLTVSGWVNPSTVSFQVIVARLDNTANNNQNYVLFQNSSHWNMQAGDSTGGFLTVASTATVSTSTWAYIVGSVVLNPPNNVCNIYVNGVNNNIANPQTPTTVAGEHLTIGSDFSASAFFNGLIDEVRISNIARSQDWITTEYNNQVAPGTFYSIGTEQGLLMGAIML